MDFNKVEIVDIETPPQCFLLCAYIPEEDKIYNFLINHKQNDLFKMVSFLMKFKSYPHVGWNNLSFDNQIVEEIVRKHEEWVDLDGLSIAKIIHEISNDNIAVSNAGGFSKYRESDLTFRPIDLFRIHHGDNKNRRGSMSLKCMEFYLDTNIDVFSWDNKNETFTDEEIETLIEYCHLDVMTTYKMYLLTIGQTDNPVYKDNNQIQIRLDIMEEFGIPCMNYSNSKIGDEIVKKFYCEEKGIEYKDLPKKGLFRKKIYLSKSVPDYVKFKTDILNNLLKEIKSTVLNFDEEYKKTFKFFDETHSLARGGLHSKSENKIYHSDDKVVIMDVDVGGYYVVTAIEREYFPEHLGRPFLNGYKRIYQKRMELKPLSKKDLRIKGIVQGLKEGGVSVYG